MGKATTKTSGQPRLRKRELFAACGYRPHPGQQLVHASKASRRVLACGVRWGKSTGASMEAVAALFEPRERALGWIVGPTYGAARRVFDEVVRTVQQTFPHRIRRYDPREHVLTVVNLGGGHSTLRGKSADNPVSLLSEALDFVVVDEAARMDESIWQQHLSQRLVDRAGWALLLSTPRAINWFRRLYRRGQHGNDPDFESWSQPSWTNPHVSKELIDAERGRMPEDLFEQEYGGKFIGTESEPCPRCGWPDVMACSVLLIRGPEDEPRTCIDCGRYTDAEGHTVCGQTKSGEAYISRIYIRERTKAAPPVPGVTTSTITGIDD